MLSLCGSGAAAATMGRHLGSPVDAPTTTPRYLATCCTLHRKSVVKRLNFFTLLCSRALDRACMMASLLLVSFLYHRRSLGGNQLSGTIPNSIGQITNLRYLCASHRALESCYCCGRLCAFCLSACAWSSEANEARRAECFLAVSQCCGCTVWVRSELQDVA